MSDTRNPERWLDPLDPPPGGLAALRRRLDARTRRRDTVRRSVGLVGAAAGLCLVAFLAWGVGSVPPRPLPIGDDFAAIRFGLTEAPTEAVSLAPGQRGHTALMRIPTGDDRVLLYLVGSASGPAARPTGG